VINFTKEDQTKSFNHNDNKVTKRGKKGIPKLVTHFDTLDQGTAAFMQWLGSEDKMSTTANPIILKDFVHTRYSLLYDNVAGRDIKVETQNGVPKCTSCNTDDCGHVGFVILLEQKYENDGTIFD
jgi:hypothetical protein